MLELTGTGNNLQGVSMGMTCRISVRVERLKLSETARTPRADSTCCNLSANRGLLSMNVSENHIVGKGVQVAVSGVLGG